MRPFQLSPSALPLFVSLLLLHNLNIKTWCRNKRPPSTDSYCSGISGLMGNFPASYPARFKTKVELAATVHIKSKLL